MWGELGISLRYYVIFRDGITNVIIPKMVLFNMISIQFTYWIVDF